ncbi:hypothetical protein R1sor_006279 [Riccia sorocarpa]|uniref:Uncharacterized protein n=1 Tax=Riccia sorocarpa TaxID=122646 RepID=A0ABD3HLZ1_9MARC
MAPTGTVDDTETKNIFLRLLIKHWTVDPIVKTPEEEEREKYLFLVKGGIRFNRWMLFISSFLIQFCCGSLYSWSNFNAPIDILIYGTKTANRAPNTFYIAVGMFGTTAMILGPWLERHGPRRGLLLGSTVFAVGQGVASLSLWKKSMAGVYVGYGVLGGFGLGLNYISPVSALQKYFPDFRGVASGFAVAGFGAGSTVWSKVYIPMMDRFKLPETFAILGAVLSGTMLACSIVLRTPPNNFTARGVDIHGDKVNPLPSNDVEMNGKPYPDQNGFENGFENNQKKAIEAARAPDRRSLIESLRSPDFVFMYLTFFANQLFGLVALSRLATMVEDIFDKTKTEASNVVSINGVFNCVGRLTLPMLADVAIKFAGVNPPLARKSIFFFNLVVQIVVISVLPTIINHNNYGAFRAVMWSLTFVYGAGFGTIPCFLTDMFGPYNIGALHGMILTAWSIGGVGGGLGFTSVFDRHKPSAADANLPGAFDEAYESNFHWIRGVLIGGLILLFFIRTNPFDRSAPGWRFSIFGVKIIHIGGGATKSSKVSEPETNSIESPQSEGVPFTGAVRETRSPYNQR